MRVVEFSALGEHLHLITEADTRCALSRLANGD
jgi:hypothetical protein